MSHRMSEFFGILEFRLHFGKAHLDLYLLRFLLGEVEFMKTTCDDWDIDLSQRIFEKGIWVTFSMSQLVNINSLPDNFHYRVDGLRP